MSSEMPKDIVEELLVHAAIEQVSGTVFERAAVEIERLRKELDTRIAMCDMRSEKIVELTNERDDAWLRNGRILNEIDCRIQHGAESNGHLEGIYELFKGKP